MMDITAVSLILVIVSIVFFIFYVKHRYEYWKRKGFPYIAPTFPYGNLKGFGAQEQFALLLDRLYKHLRGQGPIGGAYFFWNPIAILLDIELIKRILITDFGHFEERGIFYNEKDDPLSAHLFALNADKWRPLRRKMSPTFTSGKMKFMFPTILKVADNLRDRLTKETTLNNDADIEIYNLVSKFTIDVIGTCAFGIECNSLDNKNEEFRIMGSKLFNDRKQSLPVAFILESMSFITKNLGFKTNKNEVSEFFMNLVKDTVSYRDTHNIERNDFLDILLKLRNHPDDAMTLNEISAQVGLFFAAGFDTSATTLTYSLYELAKHPTIQEKVRQEIKRTLSKHNGQYTYEAVMEMEYMNQVITETLRKHPPVGQLVRRVTKTYQIPNTKHILPKGMLVFIPVYSLQRDPDNYSNPEEFRPERFSNDDNKSDAKKNDVYLPFGDGPRNCIGMRFGMMQIKVGLVTILSNYDVSVCRKTTSTFTYSKKNIIMVPDNDVWLNLKKL